MYNETMDKNNREYTDKFTDFSKKSISDFILYNSGIEYCEAGYSYGPKRRDYHFIHFVKEGNGSLEINDKRFEVHENQLFIVPAGEISTYTASMDSPWKYSWIGFLGIQSHNYVQMLMQSSEEHFVLDCADAELYETKIMKIIDMSNDDSTASFLKINGVMYDIIGTLLEECIKHSNTTYSSSVSSKAVRYMDLHYHDDIHISDIADFAGIHPSYLAGIFKSEMGISPKKYLTNLKINKAKELLIATDDPINIIGSSVGFSDALSFSKFFRKETSLSPSQYRKDYKK
ncbi:AraC family transcriptional regulator [Trichococcus alkaliphilus]|uniref:AraC family transcriptional regulator n=1 Tax=Trichococcus alkaliphilus TaxID=2052943 RepID=UPI000D0AC4F2|nr:AraC family transcriptional regulator [Trichococcus alkaliphilus]